MKRILVVLVLLCVAAAASYAVSGKIFARFNKQGPVFEYWAGGGNNVDLWQQKDGTGFELGFDSFGLLYKTRPALAIPFGLDTAGYDERFWGGALTASSPGYVKIKDIKLGNFAMQVGLSWHQAFATKVSLSTNTNNGTTNADTGSAIAYNKFYIDYKFDLPLGDMITIKQYDWDLMHFEIEMGDNKVGGFAPATLTNTPFAGSAFLAYVPLNVLIALNPINITLSPQFIYQTRMTNSSPSGAATNQMDMSRMRIGGYARVNVGLADFMSIYVMGGGYLTTESSFVRNTAGTAVTTNTAATGTSSTVAIPVFAGIMWKLGPGIKLTTGWGFQYATTTVVGTSAGTNLPGVTSTTMFSRYGYYSPWGGPQAEYALFGDNMMDLAFLKFGSDAKFAGNWSLGIAGAVGLNDKWTYTWFMLGQNGVTTTGLGSTPVVTSGANQLLAFINFMNYDRQMYIKYEDENVAIKGTIAQEGNFNGGSGNYETQLFGMFEYVDLTIKF